MKTQSLPKFLLTAAAVAALSGNQALAQAPAATAGSQALAQNSAAVAGRGGAGAAQQDQIRAAGTQMAQGLVQGAGGGGGDVSVPFHFTLPTKIRLETRLEVTRDEQEKLDELGAELVSFVDGDDNIEKVRQEQVEKLSGEAQTRKDEAGDKLRQARVANRDAASDLLFAKRDEKRAKDDYDKKQKERAAITEELENRKQGNRKLSKENAERQEKIEEAKKDVSAKKGEMKDAEESRDKAKSEEKALTEQLATNEKAFTTATNEVAKSEEKLQQRKEGAKVAEDALRSTIKSGEKDIGLAREKGDEAIRSTQAAGEKAVQAARKSGEEAVGKARANGARELQAAQDNANKAVRDKAARESEKKTAAAAKRSAEKAKDRADKTANRAEEKRLAANRRVEEARKAVVEARRKDKETKGWFGRLFIPSVEKAEREVRKAEMAAGKADGEKKLADAAVGRTASELARAGKDFEAAKAAADAAGKELDAKKAAVAAAGKRLEDSVAAAQKKRADDIAAAQGKLKDDVAAARKQRNAAVAGARKKLETETALKKDELSKAKQGVATAADELRGSRTVAAEKKDAVEDTKDDLSSKVREVGEAEKEVERHGKIVEKAETEVTRLAAEGGNPLEFVKESELKDQVQTLNHEIRDLTETKDKAEKAVKDMEEARKRSEKNLSDASEAFSIAEANLNGVADEALDKATKAEEERQGRILANAETFWNKFQTRAERDAPGFVNANPKALRDKLAAAAKARKEREADVQKAEKDFGERKAGLAAAEKAVSDLEKAAKTAVAAAKDEAEKAKVQKEFDTKIAAAKEKAGAANKALTEAKGLVDKAKKDFSEAKGKESAALKAANSYDGELKDTKARVLSDAEKIKKAFYAAVEKARRARIDEKRRRGWSDSRKRHMDAIKALENYRTAKKEFHAAEKEYTAVTNKVQVQGMAGWRQAPDVVAARKKRIDARAAFKVAEAVYNQYYSDDNTFRTASLPDDKALQIVKREEARFKKDYGRALEFDGDRLWLARTSVNGISLMKSFFDEMEWQADSDENVANTVEHAKQAANYVRERAIYGGFYFAGLDVSVTNDAVNPETGEATEKLVVFVDKGRFGPTTVEFIAPQTNGLDKVIRDTVIRDTNNVPVVDGRAFRRSDIIERFVSRDAGTNELEQQAFNFIEFRKNFNALNADPDIRKANVEFSVAPPDFDYDYDYGDTNGRPARISRAILSKISVDEDPNLINRILPRPIAPIHGVLAIDNFNSMGEADRPLGEADTWMARLTLQNQHRLFDRDAALTLNGNYSLGGSLYGGAANYFLARSEDRGWADGGLADWAFTAHGGYTDVDQADVIEGLDVLGTGYYAGIQLSTRVADTVTSALDFSIGLTWRYVESSVRIEGEEIRLGPNGGDGYTILPLSAALMYSDKQLDALNGRNYATVEAVYNLGGSTADELQAFRSAIEDDLYLILRAQLARIQLLGNDSKSWWLPRLLFLRADAQWASTPVIGAEQYGLGGHGTVRGYAERAFMGDSGASGTVEFRTPINLLSIFSAAPDNPYQAEDKLQLVYFADGGWFNLQDGLGSAGDDSEFIASLGLGLRYSFRDLIFRFDWGVPLIRDDEKFDTSSAGVGHLSLQYQF